MRQRASTRKDTQGDTRDKTENRRHTAWKDQTQREHTKRRHTSSSRRRARSHTDGGSRAAHSLADGSAFNAVIRMQYGFEGRVFALHGGWTSTRTLDTQGGMHPPRRTSTNTATTHSPDRLGFSTWRGWTSGCRRWQPQPQPGPSGERPSCSPPRSWRARWRHAQTCSICEIHTNTRQTLGIRGDGAPTRFTPPPLPVLDGNVDTWMVTVIDTPLVG